ncbi:hypothetical protein BO71DRAFT_401275 [Aspergillus ellipticus CBS 707.79]|uniref:RTA1 domain protein n=1 Tax=Aspergillus ellipticus CBS 707.79 TaxID=1448320 RepID=A0A319DB90_9EURO|nr:hypothetical protein BO71DRAFT_401275 [Aspergillus ellipticus CBS 707.79]
MSATTTSITTTAMASSTQTCTNPKPGKNGYLPPEACDVILLYVPSLAAAVLFCVLYGLTLISHGVQAYIFKKRYTWVVMMGATWELLAFIFRALLTQQQNNSGYDTSYTILFLLAPLWINAFLYMTLGRLIYFFIPDQKLAGITAKRYGRIFIWLDIIAFLVQLAGAFITTETGVPTSTIMMGVHIYMGGIGLQEFFVLIFTGLTIYLHRTMIHLEWEGRLDQERLNQTAVPWRWMFYTMYTVLGMISIRIIFRLAQYAQGTSPSNPVLTHEAYDYVFDAVPMFVALVGLNIVHPGLVLVGPDSEFPRVSRQEKKQIKKEKKAAKAERKAAKKEAKRKTQGSDSYEFLVVQEEGRV